MSIHCQSLLNSIVKSSITIVKLSIVYPKIIIVTKRHHRSSHARQALGDLAQLKRGERCLIHAAAGGVGLVAIQYAQHVGAEADDEP